MNRIVADPSRELPEASIPPYGITAHLSPATDHQVTCMQFEDEGDLPEPPPAVYVGFALWPTISTDHRWRSKNLWKGRHLWYSEKSAPL